MEEPREDTVEPEAQAAEEAPAVEVAAGEEEAGVEERIIEIPVQTAPEFPWSVVLKHSATFYQKLPGGGMALVFCSIVPTGQGYAPMPPSFEIPFNKEGWARFQEEVANDGEKKPVIPTATHLPPGVRAPGQ